MIGELKPYLLRSGALHLFGAAFFVFLGLVIKTPPRKDFYNIDFLGGVSGPGEGPAAPARAKPAPAAPAPVKAEALPSLKRWLPKARAATLRDAEMAVKAGPKEKNAPEAVREPDAMSASRQEQNAGSAVKAGGGGSADVAADPGLFPFPWYLARMRAALWSSWSQRMPAEARTCVVSFALARNGSVSEVSVSDGSGDSDFDYAALASVQEAAPFPPLPEDFKDPTLKVHVKFQSL